MDNQIPNQTPIVPVPEIPQIHPVVADKPVVELPHDQLMKGLYFLLDAFDRAQVTFFLVRQTAKDAINQHQLTGDHLDVGVRNNEWINGNQEILFPYFDQENVVLKSELPDSLTYEWQDIPFTIHFYNDNECITALNTVAYEYEGWYIPNQFERFEKEFDK
jgi:hypothetical protein